MSSLVSPWDQDLESASKPMSSPAGQPNASTLHGPATRGERPPSGHWWYAFDRWLQVAGQDEEFVLA